MSLRTAILAQANPAKAKFSQRFFKTGPGQYAQGDHFLGLTVPQQRVIAKRYANLNLSELKPYIKSAYHEFRFIALEILVMKYEHQERVLAKTAARPSSGYGSGSLTGSAARSVQRAIVRFYLKHLAGVNNWDLVDTSAPYLLGAEFAKGVDRTILLRLASSKNFWRRRVAVVSTFALIRCGEISETLKLAKFLLGDSHDLIHKACGWMLREAAKQSQTEVIWFIRKYKRSMPRTMLRYAIERLPLPLRRELMA